MITARLTQKRYEEQRKLRREAVVQSRPAREAASFARRDEADEAQSLEAMTFKERRKKQKVIQMDAGESKDLAEKVASKRDKVKTLERRLQRYITESQERDEELVFLEQRLDAKQEEIDKIHEERVEKQKQADADALLEEHGCDDEEIAMEAEAMLHRRRDLLTDHRDVSEMAGFLQGVGVDPFVGQILDLVKHLDAELTAKNIERELHAGDDKGPSKEDEINRMNSALEKDITHIKCTYEGTTVSFRIGEGETVDQLLGDCSRFFEMPSWKIKVIEGTSVEGLPGPMQLADLIKGRDEEPELKVVLKNADEWDIGGGNNESSSSESEKEDVDDGAAKKDEMKNKPSAEDEDVGQKIEKSAEELEEEEFNRRSKEIDDGDEEVVEELMYRWNNFRAVLRPAEERLLAKIFHKDTLRKNNEKAKDYCRLGLHFCFLLLLVVSSLLRRPPNDAFHMAEMIKDEINRPVPYASSQVEFTSDVVTPEITSNTERRYTISVGPYITFKSISNLDEMWKWLYYSSYFLFPGKLYSRDNTTGYLRDKDSNFQGSFYMQKENKYYLKFYNRLIGGMRFRQIRISTTSCTIPAEYDKFRDGCMGVYFKLDYLSFQPIMGESTASTASYAPSSCTSSTYCDILDSNAWNFRTRTAVASTGFGYIDENIAWDDGGGFVVDIPFDTFATGNCDITTAKDCNFNFANTYRKYLQALKWNYWVDLQTRGLFMYFNIYNNFYDMLAVVNLKIILTRSGAMNTISDIKTIKPTVASANRHSISFLTLFILEYICVFCYWLIFIFNILQYTKEQIEKNAKAIAKARAQARKEAKLNKGRKRRQAKKSNIKQTSMRKELIRFFFDFWNMLIFLILLQLSAAFVLTMTYILHEDRLNLDLTMTSFKDLEQLASLYTNIFNLEAAAIFLAFLYSFRYLRSTVRMFLIFSTLSKASHDLLVFVSIFAVIFAAFGLWGFIAFGSELLAFSTPANAVFTLEEMMVGEYVYTAMRLSNEFIAPMYFIIFILLVFFLLTNVFIALLTEAYYKAKEDERDEEAKDILVSKTMNVSSTTAGIIKDSVVSIARAVIKRSQILKLWKALTGKTSV